MIFMFMFIVQVWLFPVQLLFAFPSIGDDFVPGDLGKPHVRIFNVQPEFCRKGGGVESPCQMGCGTSLVNMNHY